MFIPCRVAGVIAVLMAVSITPAWTAEAAGQLSEQSGAALRPVKVSTPPLIDGSLDDEAWRQTPMPTGQWLSYNPLHGDNIPQQTTVWITYDADYMYFAFKCDDPEPKRIRTSVTRRDNAWPDDWVGLSLDALGTGQIAYHMMVNPSGVQMDMLQTVAGGEDQSVDWVWDSAGRLTDTGYAVELRLPLQSIRFRGGENVKMGILFWRRVSRIGVSVSWPALEPGRWVFEKHAALIFPDIQPRLPRQVIPSTTYARSQSRDTPSAWGKADGNGDFGVTTKMGLSPTITLDATVNPDFSQVESDAFQVQVNQRYPVFFSEKRPFFMEGLGLFNLAGMGDGNMRAAVHTRKIVDPGWGVKVTGTSGPLTFGFLDASDHTPLDIGDRGEAVAGESKIFTVARATYGLKGSDYIGAIVTDTEHAGRHNRVAGGDLVWKPFGSQELSATYLFSRTGLKSEPDAGGVAAQVSYKFDSRRVFAIEQVEHYDTPFQMDTAFYNQTGFTSSFSFVDVSFYPPKENRFGLIRVHPFTLYKRLHDRVQDGDANFVLTGLRFNFSR